MKPRIILAYDGRPHAANAIAWLARHHDADVVTLTLDVGEGAPLDGIRERALAAGAIRAHVLEVQEEFAREIVIPAARADVFDAGVSLDARARPLLAKKLVDVAQFEKATSVAYVPGDDQGEPLEGLVAVLNPNISVITVNGVTADAPARTAQRKPPHATATAAQVEIAFSNGVPTMINGISMRLPELLQSLATIAAEHGITGDDYFTAAAAVLHAAYQAMPRSADGTVRLTLSDGKCAVSELLNLKI